MSVRSSAISRRSRRNSSRSDSLNPSGSAARSVTSRAARTQFHNVPSAIPSDLATSATRRPDDSTSASASRRNCSGYFVGRPIRASFLHGLPRNQVSKKPGHVQTTPADRPGPGGSARQTQSGHVLPEPRRRTRRVDPLREDRRRHVRELRPTTQHPFLERRERRRVHRRPLILRWLQARDAQFSAVTDTRRKGSALGRRAEAAGVEAICVSDHPGLTASPFVLWPRWRRDDRQGIGSPRRTGSPDARWDPAEDSNVGKLTCRDRAARRSRPAARWQFALTHGSFISTFCNVPRSWRRPMKPRSRRDSWS